MLKRYHHIVGGLFRIIDASVVGIAWLLSYWVRFHLPILEITKGLPSFRKYAALGPLAVSLWLITFSSMKVYQSQRMLRRTQEIQLVLKAHFTAILFFILITYLFSEYHYSRIIIGSFALLSGILLITLRLVLRNFLRFLRVHGYNLRHILVVGDGPSVKPLLEKIRKFPELGFKITGILTHETSTLASFQGIEVLGHFGDIQKILEKYKPDQILLALARNQYTDLEKILTLLKTENIHIQLIPDVTEYITLGCEIEDCDGLPLLTLNQSHLIGFSSILKRSTDIVLASLGLILLSPLLLLLSLLIKCTSRGSILYRQERMGLDGITFSMLKFRSMQENAEQESGAVWASASDTRRTKLGTFLRKTSLDELPQLWNVLHGEMSLVGPRPERPIFIQKFKSEIPHYMLRHKMKAGMTGWAQIHGFRGNTSLAKRIQYDLHYIQHWSYFLDLKILVLTLWKGFKNAY
jgi:Undecaprenyl-phosphate glucose phosphotransferase